MGQNPVLVEELKSDSGKMIGHVCLNTPETLNALSLEMIDQLSATLTQWQSNDDVVCVILSGSGDKAFCAGGDVKNLYQSIIDCDYGDNAYANAFFSREYRLDYLIHTYGKPLICWGNGIVMGGRYGPDGRCLSPGCNGIHHDGHAGSDHWFVSRCRRLLVSQ